MSSRSGSGPPDAAGAAAARRRDTYRRAGTTDSPHGNADFSRVHSGGSTKRHSAHLAWHLRCDDSQTPGECVMPMSDSWTPLRGVCGSCYEGPERMHVEHLPGGGESLGLRLLWAEETLLRREITGVTDTDLEDPTRFVRSGEVVLSGLVWWAAEGGQGRAGRFRLRAPGRGRGRPAGGGGDTRLRSVMPGHPDAVHSQGADDACERVAHGGGRRVAGDTVHTTESTLLREPGRPHPVDHPGPRAVTPHRQPTTIRPPAHGLRTPRSRRAACPMLYVGRPKP